MLAKDWIQKLSLHFDVCRVKNNSSSSDMSRRSGPTLAEQLAELNEPAPLGESAGSEAGGLFANVHDSSIRF